MAKLKLIRPTAELKESFLLALQESEEIGEKTRFSFNDIEGRFEYFVSQELEKERTPTPERVLETVYWGFDDENYIGRISVCHYLNDYLKKRGGHIGYDVRPSFRRRGFATEMLALTLAECCQLNLKKVLITCDDDNIGSAKAIEKNGGVLESTDYDNGKLFRRYWVEL